MRTLEEENEDFELIWTDDENSSNDDRSFR